MDCRKKLLMLTLLVLISACSDKDEKPPVIDPVDKPIEQPIEEQISDPNKLMVPVEIKSISELKTRVNKNGALAFTAELREDNPDVSVEQVVRLLKENNRNIEYKKLEAKGLTAEVITKLKKLPISPKVIEKQVQQPDPEFFPMFDWVSDEALTALNEEKLSRLNRKLALTGQAGLSITEFTELQKSFSEVEIIDNFGSLDRQFQNVLIKDTSSAAMAISSFRSKTKILPQRQLAGSSKFKRLALQQQAPQGYIIVNPSSEWTPNTNPSENLEAACLDAALTLPMQITQAGTGFVDNSFKAASNGSVVLRLPYEGLAHLQISTESSQQVVIRNPNGHNLIEQVVDNEITELYLPITGSDICQAFIFEGAENSDINITLTHLLKPQRISDFIVNDSGEVLVTTSNPVALSNASASTGRGFSAQSYSFNSANPNLEQLGFRFNVDSNSSQLFHAFDVIAHSPSGQIYAWQQHCSLGFCSRNIDNQMGIWRLDVLPPASVQGAALNSITQLQLLNADTRSLIRTINMDMQVRTESKGHAKEFMLGMLNNVSLKTQGEDNDGSEGEVKITLNTKMSPNVNIPSYMEDGLNDNDQANDSVALWHCWKLSEKTGNEFAIDGACFDFVNIYEKKVGILQASAVFVPSKLTAVYGDDYQNLTEAQKTQAFMTWYSKKASDAVSQGEYLHALSNYYDLYTNWVQRSVVVDASNYPFDSAYKTRDHLTNGKLATYGLEMMNAPVIINTHRPIFGSTVYRVSKSTLPITFDYTAADKDEYDSSAATWSVVKFVANQVVNVIQGNLVGLVCASVSLADDLHQLELDAEDDPLGSAKMTVNRYSESDPFYGLHNQKYYSLYMSGFPENNIQIDTFGQSLDYAQMACSVAGLVGSVSSFAGGVTDLINMDYASLYDGVNDGFEALGFVSQLRNLYSEAELSVEKIEQIANFLEEGKVEQAKALLPKNSNKVSSGTDLYADLEQLLNNYKSEGSAGNGNNVVKSNAQYLLGTDKKTRANVSFIRVDSAPVTSLSVSLDSIDIYANGEDGGDGAEIMIKPFVGIVSDKVKNTELTPRSVFYDQDFPAGGWDALYTRGVEDGDTLNLNTQLYSGTDLGNVAAIYLEVVVFEDDEGGVESNDMIGVYSDTILIEKLFNTGSTYKAWKHMGGSDYQLTISQPIYNSKNQQILENPLDPNYSYQKKHNRFRQASAKVNLTINLSLGDLSFDNPKINTGLAVDETPVGKETYSMNINTLNDIEVEHPLYDVYQERVMLAATGSNYYQDQMVATKGNVYSYNIADFSFAKLFDYDFNDFSGELLPLKAALTTKRSLHNRHRASEVETGPLPLFHLLDNNRIITAVSGDDGARIMLLSYDNQGLIKVLASHKVSSNGDAIYTLTGASLSPDRSQVLVTFISEDYHHQANGEPPIPRVQTFRIGDDSISFNHEINPSMGVTNKAIFIDNNNLAFLVNKVTWMQNTPHNADLYRLVQEGCTATKLTCMFTLQSQDIFIYHLDTDDVFRLKDSHNLISGPSISGEAVYWQNAGIQQWLKPVVHFDLSSSITEDLALLRNRSVFYKFDYDNVQKGYFFNAKLYGQRVKSVQYNPENAYYCKQGLSCAGQLNALIERHNEQPVYTSSEPIGAYLFADYDRDLIISTYQELLDSAGESCTVRESITAIDVNGPADNGTVINEDCILKHKLTFSSLYDGLDAFKGPQIAGSIFGTEILKTGADNKDSTPFEFTVTDRDTRIDQLQISVSAETIEETQASFQVPTPEYTASCTTDANGNGLCSGAIFTGLYNANVKQKFTLTVSDGIYDSKRSFIIHSDREAPELADLSSNVSFGSTGTYQTQVLNIDSLNAANNCAQMDNCHLTQNGFVDEWTLSNAPAWFSCQHLDNDFGGKRLSCAALPPLGAQGTYQIVITAKNSQGSVSKTITITVAAPDVIPDVFAFSPSVDAELDTLHSSNAITIAGLNTATTLSILSGEYWRSSTNAWLAAPATATDIFNGEQIKLRAKSSDEYSNTSRAEVEIGGIAASYTVTTKADPVVPDTTPDAFVLGSQTDLAFASTVQSAAITITGINKATAISITGGEYSIDDGNTWLATASTVTHLQQVMVRHTSGNDYSVETISTLTIGGVSAHFSSTTVAIPVPDLDAGAGISSPTIGAVFSFTPNNTGGEASTWAVADKPAWANFDEQTGTLSGTVTGAVAPFSINITASNASGSDNFTSSVTVMADQAPYINGHAVTCSIDDDVCDFAFTDNSNWRGAVTQVLLNTSHGGSKLADLVSIEDYELSAGLLRLKFTASNHMPKSYNDANSFGEFEIQIVASSYDDVRMPLMVSEGEVTVSGLTIEPAFEAGKISTISLHAANRFGSPVNAVFLEINNSNDDLTLTELYQYRQQTETTESNLWKDFSPENRINVDDSGNASFDIKVPGCVDLNDGFSLEVQNEQYAYQNTAGDCVDTSWLLRQQDGYIYSNSDAMVVDDHKQVYRASLRDNKISLDKHDINGQMLWSKELTTTGTSWLNGLKIVDNTLFIAGATNIDIDGAGTGEQVGDFDLFVQRLDLDGDVLWTHQFGTVDPDYLYGFEIQNGKIHLLAKINTQANMSGDTNLYSLDLDGSNEQLVIDNSILGRAGYAMRVHTDGNYFLLNGSSGLIKYSPSGEPIVVHSKLTSHSITDMILHEDSIYLSTEVTKADVEADALAGEIWNDKESKVTRIIRFRTDDLSIVWTHLVQSDVADTYIGDLANGQGKLNMDNGILYLTIKADKELYYDDTLSQTPLHSFNLLALNPDGQDNGSGVCNGQGKVLAHKSWATGPQDDSDDRNNPSLKNVDLIGEGSHWLYLSLNATQAFNSSAQIGRSQSSPYPYYSNNILMKTQLEATPEVLSLPLTGIIRNDATMIVSDHDHNLQWDDSLSAISNGTWETANGYCSTLELDGHDDWRLPIMEDTQFGEHELGRNSSDPSDDKYVPLPNTVFVNIVDDVPFWSGTELGGEEWHIAVSIGAWGDGFSNDSLLNYRCVRDF